MALTTEIIFSIRLFMPPGLTSRQKEIYNLLQQQGTAENGEIVCAVINGEATLKRFFKKERVITLKAENEKYAPIIVSERQFRIAGRVVGC